MSADQITPHYQKGQAVLEMIVVIPFLALLVAAALAFGPLIYMRLAIQQAAYDCAVAAAQSLDAARGMQQGLFAANESFGTFNLNSDRANVQVYGSWDRSGVITCSITYSVPTGAFPFHGLISLPSNINHIVSVPPQTIKSQWR
jgi:Flp pilus assembly protein TadG